MANLAQQRRNQTIAQIMARRANEKLEASLIMEEVAIFHGKLPILDADGTPTGEYQPVEAKDRLAANRHYIDTLTAPARSANTDYGNEAIPMQDAKVMLEDEDALASMSDAELRQLTQVKDAVPDVETENPWQSGE